MTLPPVKMNSFGRTLGTRIPLKLSLFLARRISRSRERTFSRFIIRIAIAATALSVGVMIIATALVNGFQQTVSQKVFSFTGHIHIVRYQPNASPLTEELPIQASDTLVRAIRALPGVSQVNAFAVKSAILKTRDEFEQVVFRGMAPGYPWQSLERYRVSGKFPSLSDSGYSDQVMISAYFARILKLKTGDRILVYFIEPGDNPIRVRKLTVCGIYKTDIEEYDRIYVLGDLRLISRLNGWNPGQIGGYEVFLKDYRLMDTVRSTIFYNLLPDQYTATTIRQIYPNIFDWLNLQTVNGVIVITIMAIVALINMITAILILILERTNMIGILKAVGMRDWSLQQVFIYQASYIVLVGIIAGNIFGLGLSLLQKTTGFFKLPEETYYVAVAPIHLVGWEIAAIDCGTLLVCYLAMMIPSLMVRAVSPVKAIRFK